MTATATDIGSAADGVLELNRGLLTAARANLSRTYRYRKRDAMATAAESWSAVGGVLLIERLDRSNTDFDICDGTGRQLGESRL